MSEQVIRHPNGGAQKIGLNVHVSADSFCDAGSRIYGDSGVLGSTLMCSMVENAQIFNSELQLSHAVGSIVAESTLGSICVVDGVIHKVLGCGSRGSQLKLKDVVAENCELYGNWSLEGNARIPTGVWHRAPRYKLISGENGVSVGLTESTDGHALMACWRKPIDKWLKYGIRLGRKHRWTESQINDAKLFFEELRDVPLPT